MIYRSDTTEITADNTCLTADYFDQYVNCNPKGAEGPIQRLMHQFKGRLFLQSNYQSNGVCYIMDGIPYAFVGESDYREVLLNDKLDASSFFIVRPEITVKNDEAEATVDIYFLVNLTAVLDYEHRPVEELHSLIFNQIKRSQFEIVGVVRGYDSLSDFDIENPSVMSMQPHYCTKFETKLIYRLC